MRQWKPDSALSTKTTHAHGQTPDHHTVAGRSASARSKSLHAGQPASQHGQQRGGSMTTGQRSNSHTHNPSHSHSQSQSQIQAHVQGGHSILGLNFGLFGGPSASGTPGGGSGPGGPNSGGPPGAGSGPSISAKPSKLNPLHRIIKESITGGFGGFGSGGTDTPHSSGFSFTSMAKVSTGQARRGGGKEGRRT